MVEKQQIDIKQISIIQVGAVKTILAKSGFTFENVKEDSTKDGYTTYGTFKTPSAIIVVRLSNHICSMKNWTERYKPKLIAKPKLLRRMGKNIQDPYKERCFFSIVFKAFDYSVNDSGSWKAICNEYVFNPIEVEEGGTIGKIANDAKGLNRGKPSTINGIQPQIREVNNENENLPKAMDKIPQNISVDKDGNWVSTNGWGADYVSENKQYKTNTNMNKKLIRLTESDLHKIVKESVKKIIKEGWKDVPSDIFNALNMNNANTVGTRHFGDYDAISEKPYYQDDLRGEEPSVISIEVLKPFFINRGQGSGDFYTSAGGEQLIVLPNQIIELKEREINWISKKSEYVGEAKCSHHITKGVYIPDHTFSGTGVAKIVIRGYSALLKGQEKGFIKINWAK